ncbi:hypothetical protein [Adhaeribacter arboris]|nr:hypothetical protein [Adhaeribacter arboris]
MSWANLVMDLASIPDYKTKEEKSAPEKIEITDDNLAEIDKLLGI